ncbi:SIR2 family protein [Aeromonas salmonicida]|uniref:SIR2 family protein n=1 Tax=Aeromonas salmonicida TaxID=645 RepID=UPI003D1ECC96
MNAEGVFTLTTDTIKKFFESSLSSNFDKILSLHYGNEKTHKQKINEITNWYRTQRLVMVLGAGTSVSYGLPDWNTLLQKLLLITIRSDDEEDKNNIEKAGVLAKTFTNIFEPNSLISARYLNNYFKKTKPDSKLAFETAIRDALYVGVKTDEDSALLKEIRQFCIAAGKSPNLDSIITYNYDDLMEQCLRNIDVDIPFMPIHARGMKHETHQLPIYHIHGFLPQKGQLTTKNKVVLSEDGYHQQYSDVYGWSNLIQINKFKDHNCLFIGLSFSDPNLRRLLDIAKNERGDEDIHHYCFKKKHDKSYVKAKLEKILSENEGILDEKTRAQLGLDNVVDELIKLMEKFEENDALSFGVGILWVNDHNEIPKILKNIRLGL